MSRIVRCGLIQAANAEPADSPIEKIKQAMIDKHVAMIEDAENKLHSQHIAHPVIQRLHRDLSFFDQFAQWQNEIIGSGEVRLNI